MVNKKLFSFIIKITKLNIKNTLITVLLKLVSG